MIVSMMAIVTLISNLGSILKSVLQFELNLRAIGFLH